MTYSKEEKEIHMQLWKESGVSKADYARESGLKPWTFYSWFYKMNKVPEAEETFIEILAKPEEDQGFEQEDHQHSLGLTLRGGYNLVIPPLFNTKALTRVLDVLENR